MQNVWSPSELTAKDFGSVPWLIEPLVSPGAVLVIFGPREAGKTQLIFTMFKSLAEGIPLLGRFPASKARVALVEVDMTVITTKERLVRAQQEFTFQDDQLLIATPNVSNILTVPQSADWVTKIREFRPDVVAFDSLRKIHSEDESNPGTPSRVYSKCKALFPGASLWFAHHVKKPPATWLMEKENYDPGEDTNVYRGTTAWLDDADASIYLHKDAKSDKRSFRLVRARYAPDDVKREVIGVSMAKGSLFLNTGELSPQQAAIHFVVSNPKADLEAVVDALREQFPGKSKATYYNWAHGAGV